MEGLLVDDFEDGDTAALISGSWYGYTDGPNGGLSTIQFGGSAALAVTAEGYQSAKALEATYTFDMGALGYQPFVGVGVALGSSASPLELSAYQGIAYVYRGGAHRVQVQTSEVTDFNFYGMDLPASATWKSVVLPFRTFAQQSWGEAVPFAPAHVTAIDWQIRGNTGDSGAFALDDLKIVEHAGSSAPDMVIRPVAPPLDSTIDSIAIANPLQAKALRWLDRGYNLTNWLEQERFTEFKYGAEFVEQLAAAGFKGLRLPIDLDLYVESASGSGDALAIEVHPDLFEVLDAFDAWTQEHGLSLTIDYHHYGSLLNKANPDSLNTAVLLWGKVAEHVASNPREDLFLELLNEPELSFDGVDPTQSEWDALAQRMIAAIRAHDTTHTIIFGDTNWYGIDTLSRRELLPDNNVIYAFHDYEPFIFTHQGASWANLSSVHDVPFPYDPARWSEYYSDLGFNAGMEAWLLGAVNSYYRDGTRAALRNRILIAKRWAVMHGVPVICNEFGAYDQTARLEDLARYYSDLISIFEELEIPWQHWFMVMDSDGNVRPEYRQAMHLGQ